MDIFDVLFVVILTLACLFPILFEDMFKKDHKRHRLEIIDYFEHNRPVIFKEFKEWAEASTLFDRRYDIYHQDPTMMVGIMKGYFSQKPWCIDCGLTNEEIKQAIHQVWAL